MKGDLKAYWNVIDGSKGDSAKNAYTKGFDAVTILGTYNDYPGKQKDNIAIANKGNTSNPWKMPSFFEKIIRRNIQEARPHGIYVHDIELSFEQDSNVAWNNAEAQLDSGAHSKEGFASAYYKKWAEWFWLPLKWTKEEYPVSSVGLYGVQPFRRDYYGISGRDATQIDGTHWSDKELWAYIDHYVDFYIASVYIFYDKPDSVFYVASNIEENFRRTRSYGNKPVYAYEWLRYHSSNRLLEDQEVAPYLVEAMAIVPYFSGAKGVVLWGYEPQIKSGSVSPYKELPLYARSLERIAALSSEISRGKFLNDRPAYELWNAKLPLIRRILVDSKECVVMAINPWQGDDATTEQTVDCGAVSGKIVMRGKSTTIAVISGKGIVLH
jgi:hypothetical protein